VPVEQADPDDRHAQVAGRLQVVARENAQAARVLRQYRGDAVLGREVGDRLRQRARLARAARLVPARLADVVAQVGQDRVKAAEEDLVGGEIGQPARPHRAEHRHRVTAGGGPPGRVDRLEQLNRGRVPGPAEVEHQVMQRR
jgi:hypothetical protein